MRSSAVAALIIFLYACSPVTPARLQKSLEATERQFQDHTGFVLFDPEKGKTIVEFNGDRYFTPASNTKIFTLFASLRILGDSVPAVHYSQKGDSLIFWGTGDPSFLYSEVTGDSTVYHFLVNAPQDLYFSQTNFHTTRFGSGWAWDDYNSRYSPERSPFPMYGNLVTVIADHEILDIRPKTLAPDFITGAPRERARIDRSEFKNEFTAYPADRITTVRELNVPFRADSTTIVKLLSDTLGRPVLHANEPLPQRRNTLYSVHVDSLYKVMMQESDNFIAEQLLLLCAQVLTDSLKTEIAIDYVKKHFLNDLVDEPVWVDGSGLSRYNLFTPRSIVQLWQKIDATIPRDRLFPLLATGGVSGTLRNWYRGETPFIFGKTGTLSNNHCLSGFLITRKGKVLIFSFMNSNYVRSGTAIRQNMERILRDIHEHY